MILVEKFPETSEHHVLDLENGLAILESKIENATVQARVKFCLPSFYEGKLRYCLVHDLDFVGNDFKTPRGAAVSVDGTLDHDYPHEPEFGDEFLDSIRYVGVIVLCSYLTRAFPVLQDEKFQPAK